MINDHSLGRISADQKYYDFQDMKNPMTRQEMSLFPISRNRNMKLTSTPMVPTYLTIIIEDIHVQCP